MTFLTGVAVGDVVGSDFEREIVDLFLCVDDVRR
jgi:hypothetical protein